MLGYGMAFGDHPESEVTAPFPGESIAAQLIVVMGYPYSFYWDVKCYPPTPLNSVYYTDCRGTLSGYVFDKLLSELKISD